MRRRHSRENLSLQTKPPAEHNIIGASTRWRTYRKSPIVNSGFFFRRNRKGVGYGIPEIASHSYKKTYLYKPYTLCKCCLIK